ncbi:integrase [Amycolatopsis sp. WAC 01375]|uniref:tyrosine-type recombinase/integrase n=1 Tax=Amycolatopsis sp. WAC 01375 TaxID=2203194 RepID=UPI000F77FD57|nr:tyrosine-type recombinase/integrase [Amycolatopsis sp. WAC 01375]RSM81394.1 integrase [Amycolatopsis sp. WAC 01375]
MKPTRQVRLWEIKTMPPDKKTGKKRRRPYGVRWITAGKEHSEWFATKALAKAELSKLQQAMNRGEAFDIETGLPESIYREERSPTLLRVAREYLDQVWPDMSPRSRDRLVDGLAVAVQGFLAEEPGIEPALVRRALTTFVLPPEVSRVEPSDEIRDVAAWLEGHSRKVGDLATEDGILELGRALRRKLDGRQAATRTVDTRKSAVLPALDFAERRGYLGGNPLSGVKLVHFGSEREVDPGVVVNPVQARELLTAVTYVRPRGGNRSWRPFFATLYYAALRPGEARFLADVHCKLPQSGWGELVLPSSLGSSAARYSDDGQTYQVRSLKHRPEEHRRTVPIPPVLVRILSEYIDREGLAADGRLFRTSEGGPISQSSYSDIWRLVRPLALLPGEVASPLAARPYDLRHAAVSSWIAAGVALPDVAERAGHTVDMLTKIYAKFVHGTRDAANRRIEGFLDDGGE